jgi:hypothetical protein
MKTGLIIVATLAIVMILPAHTYAGNIWQKQAEQAERERQRNKEIQEREIQEKMREINAKMETNKAIRTTLNYTRGVGKIGTESIELSRCLPWRRRNLSKVEREGIPGPAGAPPANIYSSFWVRSMVEACQKFVNAYGLGGLDCSTCSGTWQRQGWTFAAENERLLSATGYDAGYQVKITDRFLTFAASGMSITFKSIGVDMLNDKDIFHNLNLNNPFYKQDEQEKYRVPAPIIDEANLARIEVVEAQIPAAIETAKQYLSSEAISVRVNAVYAAIDAIWQEHRAAGMDAMTFAKEIALNPNKITIAVDNHFRMQVKK